MMKYTFLSITVLLLCSCAQKAKEEQKAVDSVTTEKLTIAPEASTPQQKEDTLHVPAPGKEAQEYKAKWLSDNNLMNMEQKETIIKYDLSSLFTETSSLSIYGFIGDNYQRIRVKFVKVAKDPDQPDTYLVQGKTKVKNNICDFTGTMKVVNARQYLENVEQSDTIREGFILFEYVFNESTTQKGTGVFNGIAVSEYYINKSGQLFYDDLMSGADGFTNNRFVGEWKAYNSTTAKRCNWGDYRIPNDGDFDMGAGEFYPNEKYRANGWTDYHNAYFAYPTDPAAQERERAEWWK